MVSIYPSLSFLLKNQLAKEGPDSVAPVVIPALAPTLDKSLKSDRFLMSNQNIALLLGQDCGPRAEQGVGFCLLEERL